MFSKTTKSIAIAITLLFSVNANAGFIETDWKTTGDKKATLHQETGLEWLDLTVTGGKTINEVKAMLGTTLVGWRMPTFDEIKQLAAALAPAIQTPESNWGTISSVYINEFQMFGANVANHYYGAYEHYNAPYGSNITYGLSLYSTTTSTAPNTLSPGSVYFGYGLANSGEAGYRGGSSQLDVFRVYEGVYLVSDGGTTLSSLNDPTLNANNPNAPVNQQPPVAPVNTPISLLSLALLALGYRRFSGSRK